MGGGRRPFFIWAGGCQLCITHYSQGNCSLSGLCSKSITFIGLHCNVHVRVHTRQKADRFFLFFPFSFFFSTGQKRRCKKWAETRSVKWSLYYQVTHYVGKKMEVDPRIVRYPWSFQASARESERVLWKDPVKIGLPRMSFSPEYMCSCMYVRVHTYICTSKLLFWHILLHVCICGAAWTLTYHT